MKIADETLDALFDMELPLPRPVVRSLAEGIDTILQKCALRSDAVKRQPNASDSCKWHLSWLCPYPCICTSSSTDSQAAGFSPSVPYCRIPSKAFSPRLRCCIAQPLTSLCKTHRYVDALMQDVGSPASLKPPIPPLTRYKRDVVAKQQATDLEGAPRLGSTRPASLLHVKYAFPLTSGLLLFMEWAVLHCLHWKQDLCIDLQYPKVSIVFLMCVQPLYYHC